MFRNVGAALKLVVNNNEKSFRNLVHQAADEYVRWLDAASCTCDRRFCTVQLPQRYGMLLNMLAETGDVTVASLANGITTWMRTDVAILQIDKKLKRLKCERRASREVSWSQIELAYLETSEEIWEEHSYDILGKVRISFSFMAVGMVTMSGFDRDKMRVWAPTKRGGESEIYKMANWHRLSRAEFLAICRGSD